MPVGLVLLPLLELWYGEEAGLLLALGRLDDGRDELLQERHTQQRRPVVVDEVDQETLDVGAVLKLQKRGRGRGEAMGVTLRVIVREYIKKHFRNRWQIEYLHKEIVVVSILQNKKEKQMNVE